MVRMRRSDRAGRGPGKRQHNQRLHLECLEERVLLSGDAVLRWNSLLLQANLVDHTPALRTGPAQQEGPGATSRAFAIVQAAVYDAVNSIDGSYAAYLTTLPAPGDASIDAAVAAAAHDTLVSLYPNQSATFDAALTAD